MPSGIGQGHAQPFLCSLVTVEEQVTHLHLLHKDLFERLELLRRMLALCARAGLP
ncbi:MAG: hypothetical protein M5R38_15730 [Candidatus Methylomirabilis sp.]|nr:hypothetical protein [Candidatus Methylomirabilis sp.]